MNSETEERIILVDLDCLLDTRIGLVAKEYGHDKALHILHQDAYWERESDKWISDQLEVSFEEWLAKWDKRDRDLLPYCTGTLFDALIEGYVKEELYSQTTPTRGDEFSLAINTYPYQLNNEEIVGITHEMKLAFPQLNEIYVICLSPQSLTPKILKERYDSYHPYDIRDWMKTHLKELSESLYTSFKLYVPKILYQEPTDDDEKEKELTDKLGNFTAIEAAMSILISLFYRDIGFYCLPNLRIDPNGRQGRNVEEETEEMEGVDIV